MSSFVQQRTSGWVLEALWEVSSFLEPLAFELKFVKVQSPEDVGRFLLILLLSSNHLTIYIFLGRRNSGVMGEGIRRKSLETGEVRSGDC